MMTWDREKQKNRSLRITDYWYWCTLLIAVQSTAAVHFVTWYSTWYTFYIYFTRKRRLLHTRYIWYTWQNKYQVPFAPECFTDVYKLFLLLSVRLLTAYCHHTWFTYVWYFIRRWPERKRCNSANLQLFGSSVRFSDILYTSTFFTPGMIRDV